MNLTQSKTALRPNLSASFLAVGGSDPYTYSVVDGGAGGSIDSVTGFYTAPPVLPIPPAKLCDTIQATDSLGETATAQIRIGSPIRLLMEIISKEMGLDFSRISFWNQKWELPDDAGLYILVSIPGRKIVTNNRRPSSTGWDNVEQYSNVAATVDVNVVSRSEESINQVEDALMALSSPYSVSQQEANSFSISRIPSMVNDLSSLDGAAIPYRFMFSVVVNYCVSKKKASEYFDTFQDDALVVNA